MNREHDFQEPILCKDISDGYIYCYRSIYKEADISAAHDKFMSERGWENTKNRRFNSKAFDFYKWKKKNI